MRDWIMCWTYFARAFCVLLAGSNHVCGLSCCHIGITPTESEIICICNAHWSTCSIARTLHSMPTLSQSIAYFHARNIRMSTWLGSRVPRRLCLCTRNMSIEYWFKTKNRTENITPNGGKNAAQNAASWVCVAKNPRTFVRWRLLSALFGDDLNARRRNTESRGQSLIL